jgi:pimeloyl-ACP methyl ester carboxylesterase
MSALRQPKLRSAPVTPIRIVIRSREPGDRVVDYIHRAHNWSPEFMEARRQSVSVPHDYTPDLTAIQAPVLLIHGRYDRVVPVEVSIAILNHIADSRLVLLNGKRTAIAEHARSRFADRPQRFGRT